MRATHATLLIVIAAVAGLVLGRRGTLRWRRRTLPEPAGPPRSRQPSAHASAAPAANGAFRDDRDVQLANPLPYPPIPRPGAPA